MKKFIVSLYQHLKKFTLFFYNSAKRNLIIGSLIDTEDSDRVFK